MLAVAPSAAQFAALKRRREELAALAKWAPKIIISEQIQLACAFIAAPYLGKPKRRKAVLQIQALLREKFKGLKIDVVDYTKIQDQLSRRMMLGISCDGSPDQGLIFGERKEDGSINGIPAND